MKCLFLPKVLLLAIALTAGATAAHAARSPLAVDAKLIFDFEEVPTMIYIWNNSAGNVRFFVGPQRFDLAMGARAEVAVPPGGAQLQHEYMDGSGNFISTWVPAEASVTFYFDGTGAGVTVV